MDFIDKKEQYLQLVSRIIAAKQSIGKNLYELGLHLTRMKKSELYLIEFPYFNTFLEKKIEIPRSTAFHSMKIANEYSLIEWNKYGLAKCQLLLKLDESNRLDFVKDHKIPIKDTSVPELNKDISLFQLEKGLEAAETTQKSLKIGKEPITRGSDEQSLKLEREGHQLISALLELIQSKDRFNKIKEETLKKVELWLNLSPGSGIKERIIKLKEEI